MRIQSILSSVLGALLLGASVAQAASGTWINAGGGSWANSANWSGGTIADGSGNSANFNTLTLASFASLPLNNWALTLAVRFSNLAARTVFWRRSEPVFFEIAP
jgi:hypothetical protein